MNTQPLVAQLQAIVDDFAALSQKSPHDDLSDLPKQERQALVTRAVAAVNRVAGERSTYAAELRRLFATLQHLHMHTTSVIGVVSALLADVKAGYLQSLVDLVQAETFADFLEMAQHLIDTGYKDAAAVIAGSALEAHVRTLCSKANIATEVTKPDGTITPKKADAMNSDLAAASVYSKLDQKSTTAWLDLRNKAAHGKYADYQSDQVALMIAGIRDFVIRTSA